MNFFPFRGRAGRVDGPSRRRVSRYAPSQPESLESRAMLAAGPLGINVDVTPYASYVNWLQVPGTWYTASSKTLVLNASGDPEGDASLLFDDRVNQSWNGPDPVAVGPNLSGTYHLAFNGQATVQSEYPGFSTPFTVQNQNYNPATNTTTVDLVVPSTNYSDFFAILFLNTQATSTSGTNTGFSNAKLIRPGYDANSTQLYTNEFLSALTPYTMIRYLNPDNANGQPFFNGNTLVTVDAPQVDQTGTPWEYLVTLSNQTNTDMWINLPEGATNAYVAALAGIIKNGGTVNGVTYAGLNANLKVYVEYSNEVWGGIPYNLYYQQAAVQNSATNMPLSTFPSNLDIYTNIDGTTTDGYTAISRRYLERTNDIGQIFQSVMGADPTHQKIRPVLGWQENNPGIYPQALNWFEHFFGPASTAFYGMGNANYWNPTDYSSVDAVINSLAAQETSYAIPNTIDYTTLATFYGLKNVSYEGGPSISGTSNTTDPIALAASRDPRMEQLIYQHYLNYYADGGDTAGYFDGPFGAWSPANEWGAAELSQYGNPMASPKYRGTVDVANAAPVAVTAGYHLSTTGPTSLITTSDSMGNNDSQPAVGQQGYWLLNAASAGTYDLQLTFNTSAPTGELQVLLNDKLIGGPVNLTTSGSVDLGKLSLSTGISTLSLVDLMALNVPMQLTLTKVSNPLLPTVSDPSFEAIPVGSGFAYNPTGSAWTFSGVPGNGSGVTGNNSGFTYGNPAAPDGTQVAFIQGAASITETIANWATGSYSINFQAAQRNNFGSSAQNFVVVVDNVIEGTFKPSSTSYQAYSTVPFNVTAGNHTIEFLGLDTVGGDNTVFLDSVSLAAAIPPSGPVIGDSSFESIPVGNGNYTYNPSGSAWTFSSIPGGGSGVTGNNSAFTSNNPSAPNGAQVAFLQNTGSIIQTVTNWASGSYTLAFQAAQRNNFGTSTEDFQILIDGKVVGTFKPSTTSYLAYNTATFNVTAGSHIIEFLGLDTAGGDNTVFLDSVSLAAAVAIPPSGPVIGDASFESIPVGNGGYAYNPTGSAWTFSGTPGNGSGVTSNNSGFTGGNPAAPDGTQVAFLQDKGFLNQSVTNWSAGSYAISFQAAQRGNFGVSNEDFEILIDGTVVGTFKPSTTTYQAYTTTRFTVSAGTHVVQFLGLDTAANDSTVFLDSVSIH